jgi:hypothetical protein
MRVTILYGGLFQGGQKGGICWPILGRRGLIQARRPGFPLRESEGAACHCVRAKPLFVAGTPYSSWKARRRLSVIGLMK